MTDTTDIAALHEKNELALKDLTERLMECNRLNYCMDEITAFAAFSSTLIDQLEAERQRADANEPVRCEGVPQHVHDMIDLQETIDELRAELAELKGEQVPDAIKWRWKADEHSSAGAWIYIDIKEKFDAIKNIDGAEWQHVFTAPKKPVVLDDATVLAWGDRNYIKGDVSKLRCMIDDAASLPAEIEAAGCIVKDGE